MRHSDNISARIHAHVVGSRVDVVMLLDQKVGVARFSCEFLIAMAGNEVGNKSRGPVSRKPRERFGRAKPFLDNLKMRCIILKLVNKTAV